MFTTTVFLLCSVALTPGGCPTGHCSGTHIGHLGHGHPGFVHGADGVLGGEVLWGEEGASDGLDASRPLAPVVRLRGFMGGVRDVAGELTSSDKPAIWPAVPMGPYTVLVDLQMRLQEVDKLGYMQLLQDGKVLDNQQYSATRGEPIGWEQDPEQVTLTYTYRLPCPAPGKHLLQARYLLDGRWSRLSRPLRFEASLPAPPRIIAISDSDREPTPLPKAGTISITKSAVKVRLADVTEQDSVVAYLDGKPTSLRLTNESCCRLVQFQGFVEPGLHTLTVRTVWNPDGCSVTSERSNEVVFHYYDEKVYLLKPTPSVRHKKGRSKGEKKEASYREMQSTPNDIPSKWSQPSPVSATGDSQTPSTVSERGGVPALPTVLRSVGLPPDVGSQEKPQARKESVHPFYFASAAHFPMREFGVRGEVLDRDGAVIYEDMKFSFDREGNYNVCFTIGTPAVPTMLQLRLLIQATSGGPWYTVTLQPIEFQPTKGTDGKFSPRFSRNYVVEGRSEILRRCYGEMGRDATIRREGTARFGFGLAGLSQNTSN